MAANVTGPEQRPELEPQPEPQSLPTTHGTTALGAPSDARPKKRPLTNAQIIAIASILLIIVAALCNALAFKGKPQEYDSSADAKVACQLLIPPHLKAPSTAKFPSYTTSWATILVKDVKFEVHGYVDAQNSFGAMLRTNYVCTVEHVGTGWRLVDLKIEN